MKILKAAIVIYCAVRALLKPTYKPWTIVFHRGVDFVPFEWEPCAQRLLCRITGRRKHAKACPIGKPFNWRIDQLPAFQYEFPARYEGARVKAFTIGYDKAGVKGDSTVVTFVDTSTEPTFI
jgi:hypothetical protein